MIDIHSPQHTPMTRRDFFIHLGIVVLGILIAIGLEQTVELFHHRHQVAETREALARERAANRLAYGVEIREFRRQNDAMLNNLLVLHYIERHPGTPASQLPGILLWHQASTSFSESAWNTAQQSNVTALMPPNELRDDARLYAAIDEVSRSFNLIWPSVVQARLYCIEDPDPSHLTPAQVGKEIELSKAILVGHFTEGAALVQLSHTDPSFTPAFSRDDFNSLMHVSDKEHDPSLAAAIALTNSRLPSSSRLPIPRQP